MAFMVNTGKVYGLVSTTYPPKLKFFIGYNKLNKLIISVKKLCDLSYSCLNVL